MSRCGFLISALIAVTISCGSKSDVPANNFEERNAVEVSRAISGNMTIYRDYSGTLEGVEQAVLTARIPETVTGVRIRPGDSVRNGDLLIQLDQFGPSSGFAQAMAVYENAAKTLRKMEYLHEQGAISEQQYDNARTEFRVAEANYVAARDLVEIKSPIDGVVTDLRVNIGDQTAVGQKLAVVSRTDSLRLTVGVDLEDIRHIRAGMSARVYPVGDKDDWIGGVVSRVAGSADPKTRALQVEISIPRSNPGLRPGAFAGCTIPLFELEDVVMVPDQSVILREGLRKIYVVEDDTAVIRDITVGESSDGYTQVISGVGTDDVVVTVGQSFLQDRSAVVIKSRGAGER